MYNTCTLLKMASLSLGEIKYLPASGVTTPKQNKKLTFIHYNAREQ